MPLNFFENSLNGGMLVPPNDYYRQLKQAEINDQWHNTPSKYIVEEETDVGSGTYKKIEAWVEAVVETASTGRKNSADMITLQFRDLEHRETQGLYYKIDDQYYISYFTTPYRDIIAEINARRCNNELRMIDPITNEVYEIPVVIDYDVSSVREQGSKLVTVPNSHIVVICQDNNTTRRLFTFNTRFIIGYGERAKAFRLTGFQDMLNSDLYVDTANYMFLDLFLDEIQPSDDLERGIADNGYSIVEESTGIGIELSPSIERIGEFNEIKFEVIVDGKAVEAEFTCDNNYLTVLPLSSEHSYKLVCHKRGGVKELTVSVGADSKTFNINTVSMFG